MSFKTQTEEIQSDASKDSLYIKKVVHIAESDPNTFSFCELGLTNSNNYNPIIFNHVLLTNQDIPY